MATTTVPPRVRALAPDLARGVMLVVIAVAHSQILAGRVFSGPAPDSAVDTVAQALLTLFVDSRGYPMFAALFGYGLVQILRRREPAGGWAYARRLLRRRGLWMIAFGFAHAALLFTGDILASYGLLALLLVGALRWRDSRLLAWACGLGAAGAVAYGLVLTAPIEGDPAEQLTNPLVSMVFRIATFPFATPLNALMAAGPVLVGIWAARRRLLDEPERHRAFLTRAAACGIAIAVAGAVPQALVTTGLWTPGGGLQVAAGALHTAAGFFGGLGYAALIGVLAIRWEGRPRGVVVTALSACGQRSMTCYLAQSVAWLLLFEPYLGGLGGQLGVAAAAAVGLGVWVATVVGADALRRFGLPGPAEALLRRLVYRPGPP